jgi:uncharacterized protein (TIGR03382 family)
MKLNMLAGAVALSIAGIASADTLALWNIVTAFPTGGSIPTGTSYSVGAADTGVLTAGSELRGVHANSSAQYTSPAGNGSQFSFSSTFWNAGDYYQATVATTGYQNIVLTFDTCRSSTGPASATLLMSTDSGSTWTTLVASYAVLQSGGGGAPGTWATGTPRQAIYTVTNSATSAADNKSSVIFRMQALTGASATNGTLRVDNVQITGDLVPAPGALSLIGLSAGAVLRRRR